MTVPQQHVPALVGSVTRPADYVAVGGQLGMAGLDDTELNSLMATLQAAVEKEALAAGRASAMTLLPVVAGLIRAAHYNACMEIYRQLANKTGGLGGVTFHRDCCNVALSMANGRPLLTPPSATPTVGSVGR